MHPYNGKKRAQSVSVHDNSLQEVSSSTKFTHVFYGCAARLLSATCKVMLMHINIAGCAGQLLLIIMLLLLTHLQCQNYIELI